MEKHEYKTLFEHEETYWWFRGLRRVLTNEIKKRLDHSGKKRLLDAGAGTGGCLFELQKEAQIETFGFDFSNEPITFWKKRGLSNMLLGSAEKIPFGSDSFDFVTCIDVIETNGVSESTVFGEIRRVLKKDGAALIVAPAFDFLSSKEHDLAVHASKRYTKKKLNNMLLDAGLKLERITYLFPTFFPLIALFRFIQNLSLAPSDSGSAHSNIQTLPPFLNSFFSFITYIEVFLIRCGINFPFGSSVFAIVRKSE